MRARRAGGGAAEAAQIAEEVDVDEASAWILKDFPDRLESRRLLLRLPLPGMDRR